MRNMRRANHQSYGWSEVTSHCRLFGSLKHKGRGANVVRVGTPQATTAWKAIIPQQNLKLLPPIFTPKVSSEVSVATALIMGDLVI